MYLKAFFKKTTFLTFASISLAFAVLVYATIDKTVVVTEQLIIVPDTVSSESWVGVENALTSELSGESLYQNFSDLNAAYLKQDIPVIDKPAVSLPDQVDLSNNNAVATGTDFVDAEIETDNGGENAISDLEVEVSDESPDAELTTKTDTEDSMELEEETNSNPETEAEVEAQPEAESATENEAETSTETGGEPVASQADIFWGGFALSGRYPLAQEILLENVTEEIPETEVDTPTVSSQGQTAETGEQGLVEEDVNDNVDISPANEMVELVNETEPEIEPTSEEVSTSDENDNLDSEASTSSEAGLYSDDETIETESELPTEAEVANEVVSKIEDACLGDVDCKLYSTTFTGFSMPEFEPGTFLAGAQLRLSLAAKTKELPSEGPQRFVVEYNYGTEGLWQTATVIDIEDEISNSINGDHFLVSLEKPNNQTQLSRLQVRVSYQGNIAYLEKAFIEGLWLEVTSASFYEETDPNFDNGAINYERALNAPKFHDLNETDLDSAINELPAFTLSYSPQQGFFKRTFNAVFAENQYIVDNVKLTNSHGEVVQVPIDVVYHDDTTWTLQFLKQPQKMIPGKYTVELVIDENETLYTDTFEFYWGVLAVNTTKSMYFPGEDITLNLAALTDEGDTICDAGLQLKIIDPTYTIFEIPVEQSGFCGKNNVTDIPDYLANFSETDEIGKYTIQLQHLNQQGEVVHHVQDHFEVREYIPFDIERTAPTRIYPPAPYEVTLEIEANRTFSGDIVERVPRGFVVTPSGEAQIRSLPDYTEIVWTNVTLDEGDRIKLSYVFDAPDISPYLYLLGPLDMEGFTELRQWQIASDALGAVAYLTGTEVTVGPELNTVAADAIAWSTSTLDGFYFEHSTTTNLQRLTFKQAGDYSLSVNVPIIRLDADSGRARWGTEVRLNGVALDTGLSRSGYIRGGASGGHAESSNHTNILLTGISPDDYIEVYSELLTTFDSGISAEIDGEASLIAEYMGPGETVFAAKSFEAIASTSATTTDLNQFFPNTLSWVETRQDTGFVHSDSVNPDQIIISDPGVYLVQINVPLTSADTAQRPNVLGRVLLDGVEVPGGQFKQGYLRGSTQTGDADSSLHWSGYVVATTTNQILTVTGERESVAGVIDITSGFAGSIFMQKLPASDIIALQGTQVVAASNDWNPASGAAIEWSERDQYDATVFTHSTSSNSQNITVNSAGDYYLVFNDAVDIGSGNRQAPKATVYVDGSPVLGATTRTNYMRDANHNNASAAMTVLLPGLASSSVITVEMEQEANGGTVNDSTPALLLVWKKAELNLRPDSPTTYSQPFDNIRFASTTPTFSFSATDPDGNSDIQYEFSISTTSDFFASTTKLSGVDSGFSNTASSTDTSPFTEGEVINFQLQPADALDDLITYYWRVRAVDVTGSNLPGDWSTTQSLTVDLAAEAPSWYQTYSGQFESNTLIGATFGDNESIEVDGTASSEMLLAYGESTDTQPKYRLWAGTGWGVEGSALSVGGTINWVQTSAGTTRDEYVLVTLDQSNSTYAQIYSASTSAWSDLTLLTNAATSSVHDGIAVAYESVSGDAMVVSCDSGPSPVYRIWDGSSWSATSSIAVNSLNDCNFVELASDPASDELILVVRDTGTQYEALIWDGDSWIESRVIGSSSKVNREGMAVAYESSGDQAIITVSDFNFNRILYTTWNGVEFSINTTQNLGADFEFGRLVTDPDSDAMALCYIDDANDIGILRWDGGVWDTFTEIEVAGNDDRGQPIDCQFETLPGRDGYLLATYSDTAAVRYSTATSSDWSTEASVDSINDSFWVRLERLGDGTIVMVNQDDVVDDIESSYWNGSSWSTKETIEGTPSSVIALPYQVYDMSPKRFQFSEGTVLSPPINFTDVPNQPTWGDISFASTEPFGTDVLLRLKYSDSGTCDAYVSDIDLPGNSTGFTQIASPIDITGLSTTTYDQVCLEATLTTTGSASASLNEWALSWVRQPKLAQNYYRFYVNGSFLTPTDPWPTGVFDLAENESLNSEVAISNGETVRLRMSLQGQNVDLTEFAEAFKLQYAEGFSCSAATLWSDVGDAASTTALWRGYENAIVGDDWLDADWGRRIKLTVDNALVEEDLTDFPIYLDLSTLPSGFFDNVQNDGDDIRITEADGVTRVPFEIVSIDTGLETGEVHFKGDLASTTDTEFFVYYSNSSVSGFLPTDTYGSQNVWTNNYSLRYALDDNPAAASPQFKDSTSIGNDAIAQGSMSAGDEVAGQIGNAVDLDGSNDRAFFESQLSYAGEFTISMWWRTTGNGFAVASGDGGSNEKFGAWSTPNGNFFLRVLPGGGSNTSLTHPTDGTWAHVAFTRDSSNKIDIHANGNTTRVYSDAAISGTSNWHNFGGGSGQTFTGQIDELRFSTVRRSDGWLGTEFNNQSNPGGFYDISAEELISDGRLLPSTVLSVSDEAETYEEENPTRENQNLLVVGDDAEWDFVLQNNNATPNTNYCFRMVYDDGSLLNAYTNYPRLITNAPPSVAELEAPFDNEQLASTTPWFDFAADDDLGDDIAYQIQVSTDVNFGSTVIDRNSISNFAEFTNLAQLAQKSTFTSGETIRFESGTVLSAGTYWWRVRAQDPSGSGTYNEWSDPNSFTVDTGTTITTWYQTSGNQFATNNLSDTVASVSTNDIGLDTGFTVGTTTSTVIDFDDRDIGNAWGDFTFNHNVSSGNILYFIQYRVSGENFALIPDTDLPGNSSGFNTTVSLVSLDPIIYNEIRIVAVLTGNSTLPRLLDWTVTWSETIDVPTLVTPFDNAKAATTTPSFTFFTSDPEDDDLQYEIQFSSSYDFTASSTYLSGVDAGFVNTEDNPDSSPFNTDDVISYTLQAPLTDTNTYWWRVRARDPGPGGSNSWSNYSEPKSFTVDTTITTSVWHQTTGEQFATGDLTDIETLAGSAQITSIIREVMAVYGEGTGQAPQYVLWNGTAWSAPASAESVGAQLSWLELKASPTRPEYALATLGTDSDINFQIYNAETDTWGNVAELQTESTSTKQRTFNLAYESVSGDLLALVCNGADAEYAIWNGTSWSATSTIDLTNSNDCQYIQVASDPTSDEIIAVFGHDIGGTNDFEALVWNGSGWGNDTQFGEKDTAANEAMAVAYEESGGQAIVAVGNNPNTTLLYNIWNGSSWSGTSTEPLGDRIEWATLKADQGTDRLALCYLDNDSDIGVMIWDGSAWEASTELDGSGNDSRGRAVDCEFETEGSRDGYLNIVYSDTGATRYQDYNGSFSGELDIPSVTDTFETTLVKAGDGTLHLAAYDDAANPDRIEHRRFASAAWTTDVERFTSNASLNAALPYIGGIGLAAQLYPNFTDGIITSTPINFADGTGPRWDIIEWTDTTPGSSVIEYRVYFESAPGVFSLIPDTDLPGNSAGFTTSPVDISDVDRTVYPVLKLEAQLICVSGDCPVIQDWSVSWSEGITVSGIAREYDNVSTTTSGTVTVAVNGALQVGKTGTILGDGTWSIANVTAFPDDTVLVFVDGAADIDESVAVATYNGVGNITGMELNKRHVTFGSDNFATTTNLALIGYDNTDDEDIFSTINGSGDLTVCVEVACLDSVLKVKAESAYVPGAGVAAHDFVNFGTFAPATNTIRVNGSWNGQGVFLPDTSTIIFSATSSSEVINIAESIYNFHHVTFGETSGTATWALTKPLDISGNLTINHGTLARGTSTFNIAGNLSIGANGYTSGLATTTFDGTGSNTWGDAKASASSSNLGYVVIDGTTKTITLSGNVGAQTVTIGGDDTLNASGSGYNINVVDTWLNNNSFIPQNGTVTFVGTSTASISRGASAFNHLSFTGVGGNWSFDTPTLALNGNLTIATGTVTLPTGTTTIAGSFLNTGGTFAHNNGEVRMTSNSGGRSITQSGTEFLNAFYDLVFTGNGSWSFTESNATTSRQLRIQSGTVTFPSGQLTVGGDLLVTGTGVFAHNSGEVVLLVQDSDSVQSRTSSFNDLRIVGAASGSWYDDNWLYRLPVTILASAVDDDLTNFPVYVDLDDLNSHFFSNVESDGSDIRVTQTDGVTEVPIELVSINTGGTAGELYFRANSLSSTTDSTFYIYYGNSAATAHGVTDPYGARNVWSNGYVLVAHMADVTTSTTLNSAGTINGVKTNQAGNPVADNPLEVSTGKLYDAQDFSSVPIQHTGSIISGISQYNVSMWFNPDDVSGVPAQNTNQYGNTLYGSSLSGNYDWVSVGGTTAGTSANGPEVCVRAFTTATACNVTSGANITNGNWYYISVNAIQNSTLTARINGVTRGTFTAGNSAPGGNFTIAALRPNRNPPIVFDGRLDEVRVSTTTRTAAWQDAEYSNTGTTTDFYTAGGAESSRARTFVDTNTTVLGDLILEAGGDSVFPTGILSIGGSFDNDAEFDANSGTVRFNSTAGAETIAAGSSTFATLEFNSVTGDFTVTENATATEAINLTSAQQFTLDSGRILTTLGTFTQAANGANTTWTGSTLSLQNGTSIDINNKNHSGDFYGTLEAASSTLVRMWNSSSTDYVTSGATGAIYSQDHSGVDGDLNIYGNYIRNTGTEYWSYDTDFDGVALGGGSRQVDVKVATSSNIGLLNASLHLVGDATASTTIDALGGAYSLNATNTTLTAEYFSVSGIDVDGFGLRASTTLSTFSDGLFNITPGRSGITIDAETVDTNAAAQFFRIGFATTSAGAASNVSLSGSPASFVWFRSGFGDLYGEDFDNLDLNPGAIRFDDSSNNIAISGTIYTDAGVTTMGGPTCDGVTPNVRIVVNGGTFATSTSCSGVNGSYAFPNVEYVGDPVMVVYLDTNGGAQGSVITKTPTTDVTNMHIYQNRVITRHEDVAPLTIADMVIYDSSDDPLDLQFTAATGTTDTLVLSTNTELFVFASTTFAPGGDITLLGNGNSNDYEGTLQLGTNATFSAVGTETHTLAGRLVLGASATFNTASSTFIFNATTTGKSITAPSTITFNQIEFNGVGGGWNITAPLSVLADMYIATGTVTGTSDITLTNGSLSGDGLLSLGSGTVTLNQTNTLGGITPWTFNNLLLGNGAVVGTTTPASTATTTVLGLLTIANAHFLDAGNSIWDLAGTGTVFSEVGTLLEDTSQFNFTGNNANVPSATYYDLILNAAAGSSVFTGIGSGINVLNNLVLGTSASTTANFTTNDPVLAVGGDLLIGTGATFIASNSGVFSVSGNYDNDGAFVSSGGTLTFSGSASQNIAAGVSNFGSVNINGTGSFTITQNATATGAFTLTNHSNFTVDSGQTLALGGAFTNTLGDGATTFTGSTLHFYGGGDRAINASSTNDIYETISTDSNTNVRMWNSQANSYIGAGGVYSQDHAGTNGRLHIYGNFISNSANDHWSYATDFDGTALTSGNERLADVRLAGGASATYTGGSLSVIGTSTATTTIQNQGSGTYALHIAGGTTNWNRAMVRDIDAKGVELSGAPTVTNFSYTDHLVEIDYGSALSVDGSVINANEAKSFTDNIFAADIGVTGAVNVTATGSAVSSWRFTNHTGDIAGEDFDDDPAGDPGYITWDNSAALITVSGIVYQNDGTSLSNICDGSTSNIRLVVANDLTDTEFNTTCDTSTRAFSFTNVNYSPLDTLVLYIVGETEKATTVTTEPISSIANLHLYEDHVIVRHESTNALTIERMSVWDSSDDGDIQYTAVTGSPDSLTLPANRKLLIWTGKTFEPNGNVTVSGGGAGASYDGTLEALTNSTFRAKGTEAHSVGGSVIFGSNANFISGSSTLTLNTTGSSRTLDVNSNSLHNLTMTGVGSYVISDSTLTLGGSFTQSNGTVTFPTGTSTIGGAFNVTGGTFVHNDSPFVFTASGAGNTVRFNNSEVSSLTFNGAGSWNMTDTNATSTGSVIINDGVLTLPSGNLAVGGNFENRSGALVHNTADLLMTSDSTAVLMASSSDLYTIRFVGPATFTITDNNITFLNSFDVASGTVIMASSTTSVGGSFTATGGLFTAATGTVLLNSATGGQTINPGSSTFNHLQIGAPSGGYTMYSATTTGNFNIADVNILTVNPGSTINIQGVFTNSVDDADTTWTDTTLILSGGSRYSVNTEDDEGDSYGELIITSDTDVRTWYSQAATTTIIGDSSLYSQDHAGSDGHLNIYGNLELATSTEYWNYATDFSGDVLTGGNRRPVTVNFASNATSTLVSGTLQIIGETGFETVVQNQGSGTYSFLVTGGTFNANYYEFSNLDADGLQLEGVPTIQNLENGYYDLAVDTGSLITLSSTTLNANPSKIFDNVGFHATTGLSGFNVNLVGDTTNAWRFTNSYGNIGGEGFDIDGLDQCGFIRFDNSSCLLTEQTHFRWRFDDGLEGAPNSEWFDASFDYRKRVRILNEDNQTYATTAVKVMLPYESSMQSDFSDLRFTDSTGLSQIPFWVEKYTASTEAQVWVQIPALPANSHATTFVYYGSSTAASASNGASTFSVFDDYEDNNITEYSGDTGLFSVVTSPVFGGTYALKPSNTSGKTTDGIFRFDQTTSQGQIIRYMQYVNTAGTTDEPCVLFGVQSPGTTNLNYAVCLELFGTDRMSISRDVSNNDSSGTILASTTVSYATGWYEVEIDWETDDTITASLYNSSGSLVAAASTTDSTYTSGGYGYAFWFNNGAWDSFTARPRVATTPTIYLGVEQTDGGASFASALDAAGGAIPDDVLRLRFAIENSGLDITGQQYELEFAPKGVAPTCESVASVSYVTVPNQVSCGSSAICMATSTYVTDGGATTDLLFGTNGTFDTGAIVSDPSNQAISLDVDQNYYTEVEYVLTPTSNASDAYCLRVTNGGTPLDFYAKVAELGLQFDPTFGPVDLNGGLDISLTPGTTTAVMVTGTVTDFNGFTDLQHATATVYRSGAGSGCSPDNNNCYVVSTESGQCSFTSCASNSCTLSCQVDIFFHADPTATGTEPYEGEEWLAYAEVEDYSGGYDLGSSLGVEMFALRAISVDSEINYGALEVDSDTGSFNPTTTISNLGNVPINVDVEGDDLTDGSSSVIPADQQKVATTTFTYSGCVGCVDLSTSTPVTLGINLGKPSVANPPVETDVYWGIAIPFTASNAAHFGTNTFTPISVD